MTNHAAIQATFADFRMVKTRKVAQFVFETPLEGADEALAALGGLPRPDKEIWYAIAQLDLVLAHSQTKEIQPRPFHTLPLTQQSAILCGDALFQKHMKTDNEADCAEMVRRHCDVTTRASIEEGTPAGYSWRMLLHDYEGYR